jgi:rubrerythrin
MEDLTIRAVLDYAIEKEIEAQNRYTQMAQAAKKQRTKKLFLELAKTEASHKERLRAMSTRDVASYRLKEIRDLHITDKYAEREFSPDMDMLDALLLAIQAEEKSEQLYLDAARGIPEGEDKKVFAVLAQEEQQHKLDLETEFKQLKGDTCRE